MKDTLKFPLLIALTTTVTLLFISLQSYTHDLSVLYDSTWYFMCGKAWMNGMLPYVDFADSKGPLLWLIFGLSYHISHETFIGVFWITCLFYAATGILLYQTARLFLSTHREAFMAALLTLTLLFCKLLRNDIHTEDFSLPFLTWALYVTCRLLYADGRKRAISPERAALAVGICFGATLLIKFTAAAMTLVFAAYILVVARRRRLRTVTAFCAGGMAMLLPCCLYMSAKGILGPFLHEYFVQTIITTRNGNPAVFSTRLLFSTANYLTLATALPGLLLMPSLLRQHRYFPLVAFFWIYALSIPNGWPNYLLPACMFSLFSAVTLLIVCRYKQAPRWTGNVMTILLTTLTIGTTLWLHNFRHPEQSDFFMHNSLLRKQFYSYEYVIAQKDRPRIVYLTSVLPVYGICSNALPACKYFAHQYGATKEMIDNQAEAIRSGKADFAIAHHDNRRCNRLLRDAGYHPYYIPNDVADFVLYSRDPFTPPAAPPQLSWLDVLLKRPVNFQTATAPSQQ